MKKLLQLLDNNILKIGVLFVLAFTALYPKLPSIQITHTWVYVRLEDFSIAIVAGIWLVQLLRKKVKLAWPVGIPVLLYWVAGGVSLAYCLIFIGPHLANFFPKIAVLEWLRRVEYMILFFIAFSTIKSVKDIRDYLVTLSVTVAGVVLYGLGQHYYLNFWHMFPTFFEKFPFCFPSFQTGNEEFAKGIPLCLPPDGRTTSTFGGHYDLAAYLVIVLPILFTTILLVKRKLLKVIMSMLFLGSLIVLLFTASRTSFATYLVGISATILFLNKKKLLIPVWLVSILLLLVFSGSTAQRFLETIRFTSIVTNSQGQVVGEAQSSLPKDLQNKVSKNPIVVSDAIPTQQLPAGSSFITLPQAPIATSVAIVKSKIDLKEAERLKLQYGGLELSTVSGSFLIQKALVYDISFTTRFQGEWPRDWAAFISSPVFGTGYSSLTLASDNDYLRALGETGIVGFLAFFGIFLVFGIFLKEVLADTNDNSLRLFVFGLAGGVIGLFANATLIDVFESSKVAEGLWILLGVGIGALSLAQKRPVQYRKNILNFLTSHVVLSVVLLITTLTTFLWSIGNFFVGDDFTWLHWAASATFSDIPKYFVNAQGFFYRPIDKAVMLFLYTFFSFTPQGYHIFTIVMHFFVALGVYFLLLQLFGKKIWGFIGSMLFVLLPAHSENIFWIAAISPLLSTLFIIYSLVFYEKSQEKKNVIIFIISIFTAILALLSYEMAVIFPILFVLMDVYKNRSLTKQWVKYAFFILVDAAYLLVRSLAHTVAARGDYSYSLVHFIPNAVGNFLGYVSVFLIGEGALPVVAGIRSALRPLAIPIAILLLVAIASSAMLLKKKRSVTLLKNPHIRLFIFGLLFAAIALLPFIGLGNISLRYLYLASAGFIIATLALVRPLLTRTLKSKNTIKIVGVAFVISIVMVWCYSSLQHASTYWQRAGKITYGTLGYFKIEQDALPHGATIYIVNRPILYGNAWVFPVGLVDGLWFVYRDDALQVQDVASVQQAQQIAGKHYPYIFVFDKNYQVHQVQ